MKRGGAGRIGAARAQDAVPSLSFPLDRRGESSRASSPARAIPVRAPAGRRASRAANGTVLAASTGAPSRGGPFRRGSRGRDDSPRCSPRGQYSHSLKLRCVFCRRVLRPRRSRAPRCDAALMSLAHELGASSRSERSSRRRGSGKGNEPSAMRRSGPHGLDARPAGRLFLARATRRRERCRTHEVGLVDDLISRRGSESAEIARSREDGPSRMEGPRVAPLAGRARRDWRALWTVARARTCSRPGRTSRGRRARRRRGRSSPRPIRSSPSGRPGSSARRCSRSPA